MEFIWNILEYDALICEILEDPETLNSKESFEDIDLKSCGCPDLRDIKIEDKIVEECEIIEAIKDDLRRKSDDSKCLRSFAENQGSLKVCSDSVGLVISNEISTDVRTNATAELRNSRKRNHSVQEYVDISMPGVTSHASKAVIKILSELKYKYKRMLLVFCSPNNRNIDMINAVLSNCNILQSCKTRYSNLFSSKFVIPMIWNFNSAAAARNAQNFLIEHLSDLETVQVSKLLETSAKQEFLHSDKIQASIILKCQESKKKSTEKVLLDHFWSFGVIKKFERVQEQIKCSDKQVTFVLEYCYYTSALLAALVSDDTDDMDVGKISVRFPNSPRMEFMNKCIISFITQHIPKTLSK